MNKMKLHLDCQSFGLTLEVRGNTKNPHLRQSLLQIVQTLNQTESGLFHQFQIEPHRTLNFRDFSDAVWRAKHSHMITSTKHPGYELRLKRLKLGLNGKQFAQALGITRFHLSKVEHGHRVVSEKLRERAESVFRTQALALDPHRKITPLGNVVFEGHTFFKDLQIAARNIQELECFFQNSED